MAKDKSAGKEPTFDTDASVPAAIALRSSPVFRSDGRQQLQPR